MFGMRREAGVRQRKRRETPPDPGVVLQRLACARLFIVRQALMTADDTANRAQAAIIRPIDGETWAAAVFLVDRQAMRVAGALVETGLGVDDVEKLRGYLEAQGGRMREVEPADVTTLVDSCVHSMHGAGFPIPDDVTLAQRIYRAF